MATPSNNLDTSSVVDHPLIQALLTTIAAQWTKPDTIILTGDITSTAAPNEFLQAQCLIQAISTLWGGPVVPWLMVPGNHDVSWEISNLDKANPKGFRDIRFAPYLLALWGAPGISTRLPHLLKPGLSACITHALRLPNVLIAGLNSAIEDDHDTHPHHGYVDKRQVDDLRLILTENSDADFKILALHHHLRPLRDPPKWRDFSVATNADALIQLLADHKVDFVLHGHRHKPNYDLWADPKGWQSHIFGAGSMATVPSERGGGELHCCVHQIQILGRDKGVAYGEIHTLEAHGADDDWEWRPGRETFPAIRRFGRAVAPGEIPALIKSAILAMTTQKTSRFGEALSQIPGLFGIEAPTLRATAESVLTENGYILTDHGEDLIRWRAFRE